MGFFFASKRTPPDRRGSGRYKVLGTPAELRWGGRQEHRAAVQVVEVSHGGARVRLVGWHKVRGPAWLRSNRPGGELLAEVELVGVIKLGWRARLLRLRFPDGCPYPLFRRAVARHDLVGRPETVSPEFETRLWR